MKILLWLTVIVGAIALYLMKAAFHIDYFSSEILVHTTVRFVSGFVFLGIWVWYKHRLKLKAALYCILFLLILDDIVDYFRQINSLSFEMVIYDTFVVVWGAAIGYFLMRGLRNRVDQ